MALGLEALEGEIGYQFRDRQLLRRALTHISHSREMGAPEVVADNEQMEFLGDSILGFVASEWLVKQFPEYAEGQLSKIKAYLVSAANLHRAAQTLRLGEHLILGHGEEVSGGREKKGLLSDALEAVIAAVYLEGGLDPARNLVVEKILSGFDASEAGLQEVVDSKSALRELAQALNLPLPYYSILGERGPEHSKTFIVEVRIGQDWAARAEGSTKKKAGQNAAKLVLEQLQVLQSKT